MTAEQPTPRQWQDLLRRELVLETVAERVPLREAAGRLLAEQVHSPEPMPAAAISAMDGFAVRRADLHAPGTTTLPVSGELPARPGAAPSLAPGTAVRIMTGALVPAGADAVIEVEATGADPFGPVPDRVAIALEQLPAAGRHIRGPGEEVADGAVLAEPGDRVTAGLIGLVKALGLTQLPVRRRPRVTVVVTGDELGDGGAAPGTVRESNGEMLTAALEQHGAEPRPPLRSGDEHDRLREVLAEAASGSDLVVTTGGIGHGAFDVVKTLLGERGTGTSRFAHLALRPGGPQGMGRLPGGVPVVHLPGTPVGALVGYHLFVRPLLGGGTGTRRVRCGERGEGTGRARHGRHRPGALHALPGRLRRTPDGEELVDLLPGRRLAPYGRADAIVLEGHEHTGDGIAVILDL